MSFFQPTRNILAKSSEVLRTSGYFFKFQGEQTRQSCPVVVKVHPVMSLVVENRDNFFLSIEWQSGWTSENFSSTRAMNHLWQTPRQKMIWNDSHLEMIFFFIVEREKKRIVSLFLSCYVHHEFICHLITVSGWSESPMGQSYNPFRKINRWHFANSSAFWTKPACTN